MRGDRCSDLANYRLGSLIQTGSSHPLGRQACRPTWLPPPPRRRRSAGCVCTLLAGDCRPLKINPKSGMLRGNVLHSPNRCGHVLLHRIPVANLAAPRRARSRPQCRHSLQPRSVGGHWRALDLHREVGGRAGPHPSHRQLLGAPARIAGQATHVAVCSQTGLRRQPAACARGMPCAGTCPPAAATRRRRWPGSRSQQ